MPESKSPEYDENVQRTEKLVPNEDLIQQNLRDELTSEKIEKSKIESKSNLQATVSVPNENILPDVNMPQSETNVSQPNTAPEQKQTIEETVEPEEEFDFNKMELNQNVVDELFNPSEEHLAKTSQRLRGLSVDSIYRLAPYFSSIHWIHLRDNKGIANLDFAYLKSNLSDDQFNRMFDELFKTSLHWGNIPASGIITKLPPESIYFWLSILLLIIGNGLEMNKLLLSIFPNLI
ncbi:MAG: hypothetical protein HWD61_02040 [Parachlamydiaceae bacterium]|nr:MAG: hypothetical protein HWD61_02040 [Parachlamydiaceae bacterium]